VVQGDSARCLKDVIKHIDRPVLFWLDGHYSGESTARGVKDTPLSMELDAIARHSIKDHVIMIDDARLFGTGDYPSVDELEKMLLRINNKYAIEIKDDVLRCAL
jgi:hypothetical protein